MTAPGFCNVHGIRLIPVTTAGGTWNTCPRCEAESDEWSEVTSGRYDAQVSN